MLLLIAINMVFLAGDGMMEVVVDRHRQSSSNRIKIIPQNDELDTVLCILLYSTYQHHFLQIHLQGNPYLILSVSPLFLHVNGNFLSIYLQLINIYLRVMMFTILLESAASGRSVSVSGNILLIRSTWTSDAHLEELI